MKSGSVMKVLIRIVWTVYGHFGSEFVFVVEGTKSKQFFLCFFQGFVLKDKQWTSSDMESPDLTVFSTFYLQNSFMVVIIFFRDSFAHSQPAVDFAPLSLFQKLRVNSLFYRKGSIINTAKWDQTQTDNINRFKPISELTRFIQYISDKKVISDW